MLTTDLSRMLTTKHWNVIWRISQLCFRSPSFQWIHQWASGN